MRLEEFIKDEDEQGVGLVLQDDKDRFVFGIAGERFTCAPSTLFFCGIGGHREKGETWEECARRETDEEIAGRVKLIDVAETWYLLNDQTPQRVDIIDESIRPFILYEMRHPEGTPKAGQIYKKVAFKGELLEGELHLAIDEIRALISLTAEQLIESATHPVTLKSLLDGGAELLVTHDDLSDDTLLYPIGTASALARVLGMRQSNH